MLGFFKIKSETMNFIEIQLIVNKIEESYRLKFPFTIKIHNGFHFDFLRLAVTNFLPKQKNVPPGLIKIND